MRIPALTFCATILFSVAMVSGESRVDVLILAGQSNMVGRARTTEDLPGEDPLDEQVKFYYDVGTVTDRYSQNSDGTFGDLGPWVNEFQQADNFGPEISLGRTLAARPELNVAMIKIAVGASPIQRWLPGQDDYQLLRSSVVDGIQELMRDGYDVNLLGMVWLQGESDMTNSDNAREYASNLEEFVGGFRSDMNRRFPDLDFNTLDLFLVEPGDFLNGLNVAQVRPANVREVDEALSRFAAQDPNAWFIPTDDFTQFLDNRIHFSATDQLTLGYRIGAAVVSSLPIPNLPGDFNNDGQLDLTDIRLMNAAIRRDRRILRFDLHPDGLTDAKDLDVWVHDVFGTWFGDANLDGFFDRNDLITVWQKGKYEKDEIAHWDEGDWNGDFRFDSQDLVLAIVDDGYDQGRRVRVVVVSERQAFSTVFLMSGWLALGRRTQSRENECP